MIISHKYKFIYIRSQKTASTSLDVFFSAYCGANDVVTFMPEETPPWHRGNTNLNNHVNALHIRNFIGEKVFNEYYKFTSIREPMDKMISFYYWWIKMPGEAPLDCKPSGLSFSDWIMKYSFEHDRALFHGLYYKINDKIIVDDYIRYESLESDIKRICDKLGMVYNSEYLLHYKKTDRGDIEITQEARDKIINQFGVEYKELGYTF